MEINMCTVFEWMDLTRPNAKGNSYATREKLQAIRTSACERAGTDITVLRSAKCRGSIGIDLTMRMADATKKDKIKINAKTHRDYRG